MYTGILSIVNKISNIQIPSQIIVLIDVQERVLCSNRLLFINYFNLTINIP